MKYLILILLVTVNINQIYAADDLVDQTPQPTYVPKNYNKKGITKEVNWKGIIYCVFSDHVKSKICNLEFKREDGKTFSIIQNADLVAKHCEEHANLEVNVKGLVRESFLYNNGVLYVKDFEVIRKISNKKKNKTIRVTDPTKRPAH